MRKLTLDAMAWLATSMTARVELDFATAGDVLRKGKQELTSSRAPLHDSFRQEDLRHQAHPTSYCTELGVVSSVEFVHDAGDRE
jgi:hypothetical protein